MIEALSNKIKCLILFKILTFGILLSNGSLENINHKINPSFQPILKNIGFDISVNSNQNSNSYIGMQWMVSHNMALDFRTSINLQFETYSDIISHNIIGGKLILRQSKDSKLILSVSANKLRYTDSGNYTWLQNSFILFKKLNKYSAQVVLDQIQFDNNNSTRLNFVGSYNIFKNIFLYIGLAQSLDSNQDPLTSFCSIGFDL